MSIHQPTSKSSLNNQRQARSKASANGKAEQDTPILEAVHMRKEFPLGGLKLFGPKRGVKAVEDVSLALRPGHSLAVVGGSGSGKTTIARLLAQMYPLTGGSIRFRGQAVGQRRGRRARAYRRHVQLIFQDPFSSLNPMHTIKYHLSRSLRIYGHARSLLQEERQGEELMADVHQRGRGH